MSQLQVLFWSSFLLHKGASNNLFMNNESYNPHKVRVGYGRKLKNKILSFAGARGVTVLSEFYLSFQFISYLLLATLVALACIFTLTDLDHSKASLETNGQVKKQNHDIVDAEHGVVAADDERCSNIGADVLREGGHAVDAAVATSLCLGVVDPMASGIGGGGFMLLRSAGGQAQAFNMRETAPQAASEDMYARDPGAKVVGPLSIGVPGELAGLHLAWVQHGKLPWKRLFQPAINLADKGFVITAYLASKMKIIANDIMADKGLREVFTVKGKLLSAGDICYNEKLAQTLQTISDLGPSALYNGTIGKSLVAEVQAAGGILTFEDLQNYRVEVTDPISADVMGYTILGMPPPSSGAAGLILVLNILASYGTPKAAEDVLGLHHTVEALKHMFAMRMNLGDPKFVNITDVLSDMLSPAFATKLQKKIYDNTTFLPDYYGYKWSQLKDHGTSHFCIVDNERNALSMTTTVNYYFGAHMLSPSTGIVLNNEMADFSTPTDIFPDKLPPATANFIRPNKQPLSSMSPTIVLKGSFKLFSTHFEALSGLSGFDEAENYLSFQNLSSPIALDGQLLGVLGASGGMLIIPAVAQVFLNHFVNGMDPLHAVTTPRVYPELIPNILLYENWTVVSGEHIEMSDEAKVGLTQRGHQLTAQPSGAIAQLVVQNLQNPVKIQSDSQVFSGMLTAVCDPRKDGVPAGY
eukprot:Gb_20988 [translate_table: standard]